MPEMLIGELADQTRVSPRSLRYYEKQGLLTARRGANGYRCYAPEAVTTVRKIKALLDAGLSTDAIREILPCTLDEQPRIELCPEVERLLRERLETTEAELTRLERTKASLTTYLES